MQKYFYQAYVLDKFTGAELFGLGCTQSLAWHSPTALLTALAAWLSALGA